MGRGLTDSVRLASQSSQRVEIGRIAEPLDESGMAQYRVEFRGETSAPNRESWILGVRASELCRDAVDVCTLYEDSEDLVEKLD
ncbi:MAG: hypothetical protein WD670_03865, partial [Actinomycetota bacterium]